MSADNMPTMLTLLYLFFNVSQMSWTTHTHKKNYRETRDKAAIVSCIAMFSIDLKWQTVLNSIS